MQRICLSRSVFAVLWSASAAQRGFTFLSPRAIFFSMGVRPRPAVSGANLVIRRPDELVETRLRVESHDTPVDGMQVLVPVMPAGTRFKVFLYSRSTQSWEFHAWAASRPEAQRLMRALSALGHRAKHEEIKVRVRSPVLVEAKPTCAPGGDPRVAALQSELRQLWSALGWSERAVPREIAMLERLIVRARMLRNECRPLE